MTHLTLNQHITSSIVHLRNSYVHLAIRPTHLNPSSNQSFSYPASSRPLYSRINTINTINTMNNTMNTMNTNIESMTDLERLQPIIRKHYRKST